MKSKLLGSLLFACLAPLAWAWPDAIAPVTITATVSTSDGPYYSGYKVTVKSLVQRIGNRQILEEAVSRGRIPSIEGWRVVCRYDARMDELLMEGLPRFYVSNRDGSDIRQIFDILGLEQLGTTASGRATGSRSGKVSGTLNRRVLYRLTANYQGSTAVCYGQLKVPLRIVGTEWEYYGLAGAGTLAMQGYVEDEAETMVAISIRFAAFKQE